MNSDVKWAGEEDWLTSFTSDVKGYCDERTNRKRGCLWIIALLYGARMPAIGLVEGNWQVFWSANFHRWGYPTGSAVSD